MKRPITILDAIADPNLFAAWFKDYASWQSWFAFLAALFALPMTPEQLETFRKHTGRTAPPTTPCSEAWLVCGRRAGKSFMLALIAVYLATFRSYREHLAPGERATCMVIATDRRQARVILRYMRGVLNNVPMLKRMIERETVESFDLANGVTIEVHAASFRSTRGYTLCAALLDELAFWPHDENSAEPDHEIIAALRPGMTTIPGSMLLCASSPYARKGALFDAHRRHFGKDDPVLLWQAATRDMNPSVPQRVIDEAMEADPASAAAEYGAQFRSDIESFVNREAVSACITAGMYERPPVPGNWYRAFVDPSGGSSDAMTLAIAHRENDIAVLDAVREVRPPFSPEDTVSEFVALLKAYRISTVVGDRYGGEFCREPFRKHGINYELSQKSKSDLYRDALPSLNSCKVDLLDHKRLVNQLCSLERRVARGGRDSIDHPPGQHDDVANGVAGALVSCAVGGYDTSMRWVAGPINDADAAVVEWRRQQLVQHVLTGGGTRPW